ncbi:MAG: hypothetical protein KAT10_04260 [Sulfurimonas sp.]|nr:hypothetical protein [Sulfurimonas sp.]
MSSFIDGVMIVLFILFMIFIFGGYHKNKSAAREAEREAQEKKKVNLDNPNESNQSSS